MSSDPPSEWDPPVPPQDKRMSSHSSHYSVHKAEIGEAVSVPIVRSSSVRTQHSIKYHDHSRKASEATNATGEESMYSENQMKLGRLNTRMAQAPNVEAPLMTMNTEVEEVVPPRLRRRPVSDIWPSRESRGSPPKHAHRFSVSITDDLDRLMENASSLRSEPLDDEPYDIISPAVSHTEQAPHLYEQGKSFRHSTLSSGSYETAGSGEESENLPQVPAHTVKSPITHTLPKRPSPKSMEKARVASQQFSMYSHDEGSCRPDHKEEVNTAQEDNEEPFTKGESSQDEYYGKAYERNFAREQGFDTATDSETGQSGLSRGPSVKAGSNLKESFLPNEELDLDADTTLTKSPNVERSTNPASAKDEGPDKRNIDKMIDEIKPEVVEQPVTPGHENEIIAHEKVQPIEPELPYIERPQQGTLLAKSDPNIAQNRDSVYTDHGSQGGPAGDDGFYDIEERVVVSNPVRAKSVKDNIQTPKRKSTKRKSRRNVRSGSSGMQLKPFSYNTLINLLESINGTVIGEEFELLNIPIKEKQLIEKIVDSLSRLTSDMILDEHRYEVGLERLEKAHRVLEGFL